jgi:sortase A
MDRGCILKTEVCAMRLVGALVGLFVLVGMLLALSGPALATDQPKDAFPNPARQPSFHRTQSSAFELGSIAIPAIGVDETIRSGVSLSVIDRGVAQWVGTVGPGEDGNLVLAGHRTTHSRPFADLDRLDIDDLIYITDGDGFPVMYKVTDTTIVDPQDLWITYDRGTPMLTMFACHPKGSARYQIVVTADLVAGRLIS